MPKIKVGTILDETLYRRVKSKAASEGRSISRVIEDAVRQYTAADSISTSEALATYESMKQKVAAWGLTRADVKAVMDEDPNEV